MSSESKLPRQPLRSVGGECPDQGRGEPAVHLSDAALSIEQLQVAPDANITASAWSGHLQRQKGARSGLDSVHAL
jgi:hypothetical protein